MTNAYELLDCGDGRKLESLAGCVLDRPAPAADGLAPQNPAAWRRAAARYERGPGQRGTWTVRNSPPADWQFISDPIHLELRLTEFGHAGLFPEQRENWDWIDHRIRDTVAAEPLKVLNLFAYTGGSTLAAAAARALVTHVDASRSTVKWARRNAELSGLRYEAIRWIAEDARLFVQREIKRGRRYDAVILDPPSYGHGPARQVWQFDEHVEDLLAGCRELTAGRPQFMVFSCHSPGIGPREAARLLAAALPTGERNRIESENLTLTAASGARLDCGVCARWLMKGS
jgi:23S rRNA (cytosine1962-C5)-methyltransferase